MAAGLILITHDGWDVRSTSNVLSILVGKSTSCVRLKLSQVFSSCSSRDLVEEFVCGWFSSQLMCRFISPNITTCVVSLSSLEVLTVTL